MSFPEEQNTLRAIWMTNFQVQTQWSCKLLHHWIDHIKEETQ